MLTIVASLNIRLTEKQKLCLNEKIENTGLRKHGAPFTPIPKDLSKLISQFMQTLDFVETRVRTKP